jgi:hypothetical protein
MAGRKRVSEGSPGLVEHESAGGEFHDPESTEEQLSAKGLRVKETVSRSLTLRCCLPTKNGARLGARVCHRVCRREPVRVKKHNLLAQHELSERVVSI